MFWVAPVNQTLFLLGSWVLQWTKNNSELRRPLQIHSSKIGEDIEAIILYCTIGWKMIIYRQENIAFGFRRVPKFIVLSRGASSGSDEGDYFLIMEARCWVNISRKHLQTADKGLSFILWLVGGLTDPHRRWKECYDRDLRAHVNINETFGVHRRRKIYWLAEQLFPFSARTLLLRVD